jgi:hypothetical protein
MDIFVISNYTISFIFFFCLLPFPSLHFGAYKYGTCFLHHFISKTISKRDKRRKKYPMAGIVHKIEDTLNNGGKKDERKGETQGGYNQQDHRGGAQGQRKEGFVGQMQDKILGGGGGMTQGGYNQQEHRGGAQGERNDFLILYFIISF